jgi:hypothetical protein
MTKTAFVPAMNVHFLRNIGQTTNTKAGPDFILCLPSIL